MTLLSTATEPGLAPPPQFRGYRDAIGTTSALARDGEALGLDFVLRFRPVCDLLHNRIAALFCTPVSETIGPVLYGHGAFPRAAHEWAALDCAILRHAVAFEERLAGEGLALPTGASVSYASLADPRGRALYREALREAHAREHAQLVIKIEDIPADTNGNAVGELVQSLKPLAPRIWVHLPGSHVALGAQDQLHPMGFVLSMPPKLPLQGMTAEARWLEKLALSHGALACMDHVDTMTELEVVRTVGVRFVEGMALGLEALAAHAPFDDIRQVLESPPMAPPAAR